MAALITGSLQITIEAGFVHAEPVAALISAFRETYPGISFYIKIQSETKIQEHLIAGSTNLVFCRESVCQDFANQYGWLPMNLHLACSDKIFSNHRQNGVEDILKLPLVDTNPNFATFKEYFANSPYANLIGHRSPDLVCRDRAAFEGLIRGGAVGIMSVAPNESLPARIRVLDHLSPPKCINTVLSVRIRTSRDLIDSLFLEFLIDYLASTKSTA